ncbi:hypothetical protein DENIS_4519 [Desulfonema ishimotonii]|uniref:Dynamin family protein n=1 Tax=Desulfonema ishimotonii TaxID=45657 RepID=A0A401G329_9BACT|nr:hypothetical protein [Desulfonema ishimotonii]GBC63525.1 hypothetical protein DENIS_4519 [Desulfonema ishimotonii]
MDPKTYEAFRNRLIGLLEKAVALDMVNAGTRQRLSRICRKTLENQFEIVLAGEFQGGKSTTFNALCDGRELSPAGAGLKTSGCIVSAHHLSDPDESEWAEVRWRSAAELTDGFSDLLLPHLHHLAPSRFERVSAADLGKKLDLNLAADRKLVTDAAAREWNIWERDRAGYDPEQRGRLDLLRFASLTACHYGDPGLAEMRRKSRFSPEEIGAMSVFPKDWEARWSDRDPARFTIQEICFVFIADIRLRLRSENLGRLGCVLTDCPGLFASRWDTETARRAMFNADAILYLFDGSKSVKLSDLKALEFIRRNGMDHKLFYGCNMRGHTLADSRRILSASMGALASSGFAAQPENFALFHALLALRSVQGEHLLSDRPEPFIRSRVSPPDIRKALARHLAILDADAPDTDAPALTPGLVRSAREISGLDRLMETVEKTVVSRKARAILIENGSEMAAAALLEAEGSLRAREQNAFGREREFREQVAATELELRRFRGNCMRAIDRLDESGPDYALADDVWQRLEARREMLTRRSGERIYREVVSKFSVSLLVKQRFRERISGILKEEIDRCFAETINGWMAELRDGRNAVYNTGIVRRIQAVGRELKEIWDASALPEMNLMSGITLPAFSGDLEMDTAAILREMENSPALENVRYNALLAAGGVTGIFTATSGVIVAVYMLITRLFWVRIITVVAFLVNIIVMVLARGLVEKSLREEIQRNLTPALEMLFYEIRDGVRTEFQSFSADIRQMYRQAFQAAADRPRQVFEARCRQAETDFARSRAARLAVADHARQVRETRIQPLRERLQKFTADTVQCLSGTGTDQEAIHDTDS